MLEDIRIKLKPYLSDFELAVLINGLNTRNRAYVIGKSCFVKIGINKDVKHFPNLIKEIEFYNKNKEHINLPRIIYSYYNDDFCILVENKINQQSLNNNRNELEIKGFNIKDYFNVIKYIKKIAGFNIEFDKTIKYSRGEKFKRYYYNISDYLDIELKNELIKSQKNIIIESNNYVISHGDLLPSNIFYDRENDNIEIIDWEYISLKPKYYDIIYFILFSDKPTMCSDNLKEIIQDKEIKIEMLRDAIILCMREINNWNIVKNNNDLKSKYIYIWINGLKSLLNYFNLLV